MKRAQKVFYSYSPKDYRYLEALEAHVGGLRQSGMIEDWHQGRLTAGQSVSAIEEQLAAADLILVLLSADYLSSPDLNGQLAQALARHEAQTVLLVPIVVRHVDLYGTPLAGLHVLPMDQLGFKPVSTWAHPDEAWARVCVELRRLLNLPQDSVVPVRPSFHSQPSQEILDLTEELNQLRIALASPMADAPSTAALRARARELRTRLRAQGPRLDVGHTLSGGRYQLLGLLGEGTFGTVWMAYDEEKQETVAIKVLRQHYESYMRRHEPSANIERFYRGGRSMAKLSHPNIVRILETPREENGFHYFIMEYVDGGDLERVTTDGWLPPEQVMRAILQVGEALQVAHARGMIHRDLRPENVLLDSARNARLTDFDLVWEHDSSAASMTTGGMGTLRYSAPEMLGMVDEPKASADVYSLAATMVFALYGKRWRRPLFLEPNLVAQLDCHSSLKSVLLKALQPDEEQRYQSSQEFCDALRKVALLPTMESLPARFFAEREQPISEDQRKHSLHRYARVVYESQERVRLLSSLESEAVKGQRWQDLAELYRALAVRCADDPAWRSEIWPRLADLYSEHLHQPADAEAFWQMALEHDPGDEQAIASLSRLYVEQEQWPQMITLLEQQLDRQLALDDKIITLESIALLYRQELNDNASAAIAYKRIARLSPDRMDTYVRLEEIYRDLRDYSAVVQMILEQVEREPKNDARGKKLHSAAKVYVKKLKSPKEALRTILQALRNGYEDDSLLQLAESIAQKTYFWNSLVAAYHTCVEKLSDPARRTALFLRIARVYKEERCDIDEAIAALDAARAADPHDSQIMPLLLEYYRIGERWTKLEEYYQNNNNKQALLDLYELQIESDADAVRRSQAHLKLGRLHEERADFIAAAREYELARDTGPGSEIAVQALERLAGSGHHKPLVPPAAPGNESATFSWTSGEALLLPRSAEAIVPSLLPRPPLSEVERTSDALDKQIAFVRSQLKSQPLSVEHYKSLRHLHGQMGDSDAVACASAVISLLEGSAPIGPISLSEDPRWINASLSPWQWDKFLYHPDEEPVVRQILAALHRPVALLKAKDFARLGIDRRTRLLQGESRPIAGLCRRLTSVLNIPAADIYIRSKIETTLEVYNTREENELIPSLIVGEHTLARPGTRAMLCDLSLGLCALRPEYFLRSFLPSIELLAICAAAMHSVGVLLHIPWGLVPRVWEYRAAIGQDQALIGHSQILEFARESTMQLDLACVERWSTAAAMTIHRVVLLLTEDPALIVSAIRPQMDHGINQCEDRAVHELLVYSVSPEYLTLRKQMGLSIRDDVGRLDDAFSA